MKLFVLSFTIVLMTLNSVWSQKTNEGKVIKILSFNIYHGETMNGDFDLDVIANVIIQANPDFVALQEVDFKTNRAKQYDLVTELGWRAKLAPVFAGAMKFDGGEYGEGVLSKYSFLYTRNIALPHSEGNEPRAALEVTAVLNSGDTISFVGTHLDHLKNETDRISQVKKINEVFASNKHPTILAGDLNAVPGSTPINILEKIWMSSYDKKNPEFTFPSSDPSLKIDYVMFYPKHRWKVIKTEVIQDKIASDHCAYLVTVMLLDD